jgi:hypothetical protein
MGDLEIDWVIILKLILKKLFGMMGTGFIWLTIRDTGEIL